MSASRLVALLQGVRETGPGRWLARCPSHEDRTPSLSVRDLDGRTLVHCFGGCDTHAVLGAVGLSVSDLFDAPLTSTALPRERRPISPQDALMAVSHEANVLIVMAADIAAGLPISEDYASRAAQAAARIATAMEVAHGLS